PPQTNSTVRTGGGSVGCATGGRSNDGLQSLGQETRNCRLTSGRDQGDDGYRTGGSGAVESRVSPLGDDRPPLCDPESRNDIGWKGGDSTGGVSMDNWSARTTRGASIPESGGCRGSRGWHHPSR